MTNLYFTREFPIQNIYFPQAFQRNAFCATGPGGGIDPTCSPGARAAAASKARERIQQARVELRAAYDAVRTDAQAASDKADKHAETTREHSDNIAAHSESKLGRAYNELDEIVISYDPTASASERYQWFKDASVAATRVAKENERTKPGKGEDDVTKEDLAENSKRLQAILKEVQSGKKSLKEYVRHRKEMQVIRQG